VPVHARLADVIVLVPGYSGPLSRVVDGWRMSLALATLESAGGGRLVVSGHRGEAQRLARLAPSGVDVVIEPRARTTRENVEYSLATLVEADRIAIATDYFHARRGESYLRELSVDLAARVVPASRQWPRGTWMDAAGALDALRRVARSALTSGRRQKGHPPPTNRGRLMVTWPDPVVVAVCGSPASGKTSIAREISTSLRLPLITRDELACGARLGAPRDVSPDDVRSVAEDAMIATSTVLASSGVSFVLESSVLNDPQLAGLAAGGARILVVHVVASSAVIERRLRDRIDTGDTAMQRLLDQHNSGVMVPEIFAPWTDADHLVTIDTSDGQPASSHLEVVTGALDALLR